MPSLRLSFFYAAFYLGFGAALPYWPIWYAGRGLSPELIGIAAAIGLAARMLASPICGFWCDGAARSRDPLIILSWLTLAFWLAHIPVREPWMMLSLAGLTGAAMYPLIPLIDSLSVRQARLSGFAYGPVRAVGSAAFIVANLGAGALVGWLGGEAMLGWTIAAAALMGAAAHLLPAGTRSAAPEPAKERLRAMRELLRQPAFLLALAASGLINGSHGFYYAFSALAWQAQGVPALLVGALWATGVSAEIVFFMLLRRLGSIISPSALMVIGAAAAVVRWMGYAASPPVEALFVLQTLHALSFGATFMGFVTFAEKVAGDQHSATAMAINSALSGGFLTAVATAVSGVLFARYGAAGFASMAAPALLGALAAGLLAWKLAKSAPQIR